MPTLNWLQRDAAFRTAEAVPYRLLQPISTHGDGDARNWLVHGDNLHALKALLPLFRGQVKCIFIDPPYNTKSAFEHYDDNLEHSQWLSMMLPRLQLLREFLREDGSIWVTIDDHEGHYLKVLMDEVFGRGNFLTTFIWQKSYGGGAKAKHFVGLHEYAHCYAKNIEQLPDFFWPPDEGVLKYYKLKDTKFQERGPYRLQPLATTSNDLRPNLRYPLPAPDGNELWPAKQWQWSRERALAALAADELVFTQGKAGYTVNYKQYLRDSDGEERRSKPKSIIQGQFTQHGTYESMALFGLEQKFAFPKPEGLLERILEASTERGDLVLDSFLGSGTTAAVAQKMGRRWIGIEMGGHALTHCLPRLQKVIDGEQGGISAAVGWQGGGGFRLVQLGEPVFTADGRIDPAVRFAALAAFVWQQATRTAYTPPELGGQAGALPGTPQLGTHEGTAVLLLYNGILGDRRPEAGNVLTSAVLAAMRAGFWHDGPKVVYGEACLLGDARLASAGISFRQLPHAVPR